MAGKTNNKDDDIYDEYELLDRRTEMDFFYRACKQKPEEDKPTYPDAIFWLRVNPSLLFYQNAACLVEKQQKQLS